MAAHVQAPLKLIHRAVNRLRHRRQGGIQPGRRIALGKQPAAALLPVNCSFGARKQQARTTLTDALSHSCPYWAVSMLCVQRHEARCMFTKGKTLQDSPLLGLRSRSAPMQAPQHLAWQRPHTCLGHCLVCQCPQRRGDGP